MDEGGFNFNIVIAGLGLIGGSYAKALRLLKNTKIYGIDIDEEILKKAQKMAVIDEGYKDGNGILKKADLVIIALYPHDTVKFVKDNINNFKNGAVITDTCGVKEMVVEEINSFLPQNVEFVASHPMAGKQSCGFEISSGDIFKDADFVITPSSKNSKKGIMIIEKLAKTIGCRNVICISPKDHDRIISYTSELPHALAAALMQSGTFHAADGLFTGGSFKDATRVADINPELWAQLFTLNSDNVVYQIEKFQKALDSIKEAVKLHDEGTLKNIFAGAGQKKRKMILNEKH